MFSELNSLLDFSDKRPPKRKFILLSDYQNDGSFLIHHFLAMYIKGGFRVCFLALVQSFSHYNNVAQKLGVNLGVACEGGQVTYLDGMSLVSEALVDRNENKFCEDSQSSKLANVNDDANPFSNLSRNQGYTLQSLYNKIKLCFEGEDKPCLLLIDDLTSLLFVGVPVQEIIDFMHYCCTLMCYTQSGLQLDGCLVTLVHNDSDVDDEETLLLWKQLFHSAHMELHVRELQSGFCKDVHGQLTITKKYQDKIMLDSRDVQYKIQDKNVAFFAPGMSKAVL